MYSKEKNSYCKPPSSYKLYQDTMSGKLLDKVKKSQYKLHNYWQKCRLNNSSHRTHNILYQSFDQIARKCLSGTRVDKHHCCKQRDNLSMTNSMQNLSINCKENDILSIYSQNQRMIQQGIKNRMTVKTSCSRNHICKMCIAVWRHMRDN